VLRFSMATAGLTSPWATADSRSDRKASEFGHELEGGGVMG